jgi:hypothetical protein
LMSQRKRDETMSPRDLEPWPSERHEFSHGSYIQGPNGSEKPREIYFARKES